MIVTCEKCLSLFNDKTVDSCPACRTVKRKTNSAMMRGVKKENERKQIFDFRDETIKGMKKVLNSERNSDVSKYETQTGKTVFEQF